jgi:hypothetical protein
MVSNLLSKVEVGAAALEAKYVDKTRAAVRAAGGRAGGRRRGAGVVRGEEAMTTVPISSSSSNR